MAKAFALSGEDTHTNVNGGTSNGENCHQLNNSSSSNNDDEIDVALHPDPLVIDHQGGNFSEKMVRKRAASEMEYLQTAAMGGADKFLRRTATVGLTSISSSSTNF